MFKKFLKNRRSKVAATRIRKEKLNGIHEFPLGEEWKASPKKMEELLALTNFFTRLVEKENFTVRRTWGSGLPKDASLELVSENGSVSLQCYVDEAGQNYDRVGKISFELEWSHAGLYDAEKDEYIGEFDTYKSCSLKKALELLPIAIKESQFGK